VLLAGSLIKIWYCCDRKSPSGMCSKLCTVAASIMRRNLSYYCLFVPHTCCCSSRTSRSWWITHSTQRHRRGCNNTIAALSIKCMTHHCKAGIFIRNH